jgi:hypothetical protein
MAVKAAGQITLTSVVDVTAVYRFYLLQSSTAAKPSTPTAFPPPSPWNDTEPTYTGNGTNSLYTVEATLFSDDSFIYSLVSLSSSYEAAKVAYNKAVNALNQAVVQSATAPTLTTVMWVDTSLTPPLMKRYDSETAAWIVVNDTSEVVYNLEQNLEASLVKTQEDITATVAENYYLKEDTEALISSVSTQVELTKNSMDIQFTQFSADIEAVAAGTDAEFEEIRKYIRFVDGKILLGEVGNELELQIANDRISFLQDGAEVAYFSDRKMHITDTQIDHSLQLGNFAFMPRANGNLSFKKI